jgi:propanol-preferring alcohol dehydrogenase
MGTMRSYQIAKFGGAVSEAILDIPEPHGTEVLIKVTHAGVCHSDLHIADGYYDLGACAKLTLGGRGINLPHTMGHEVLGTVIKAGPDATEAPRRRSGLPGWCILGSAAWNVPNVSAAARTFV